MNQLTEIINKRRNEEAIKPSRNRMRKLSQISAALKESSRGVREPKLNFSKIYLANEEQLNRDYVQPKRYRDPDGFEYPYDLETLNKLFTK